MLSRPSTVPLKKTTPQTQTALSTTEDLLQTLLTGLACSSAQSSRSGGYMGQIADSRARLAQAAAEEEQARVNLDMSRRELGELKKRWKKWDGRPAKVSVALRRRRPRSSVCRRKWLGRDGAQKEQVNEEVMCRAKDDVMHCTQVGVNLLFTRIFLVNN